MHTCCAPCSVYCIDELRKDRIEPTVYWYNPNIHPYMEYKLRRDCVKEYTKSINVQSIFEEEYGLDEFCKKVVGNLKARCINYCYPVRLRKTFEYAKNNGYDTVTTTLLYSIYQNHDFIKNYCEKLSIEYGVDFLYKDFRSGFWEGHQKAHDLGLYMQKYCGCIFSEEIRYYNHNDSKSSDSNENKEQKKEIFEVRKVDNKEKYLSLLLETKQDKASITNDLKDSDMYLLKQGDNIYSVATILPISEKTIELKNIVTIREERNKGYASKLIRLISSNYKSRYDQMIVGANANFIPFFAKQGFDNYNEEIKNGDLMYYSKDLKKK